MIEMGYNIRCDTHGYAAHVWKMDVLVWTFKPKEILFGPVV